MLSICGQEAELHAIEDGPMFGRSIISLKSEVCTGRYADSHGLLW